MNDNLEKMGCVFIGFVAFVTTLAILIPIALIIFVLTLIF